MDLSWMYARMSGRSILFSFIGIVLIGLGLLFIDGAIETSDLTRGIPIYVDHQVLREVEYRLPSGWAPKLTGKTGPEGVWGPAVVQHRWYRCDEDHQEQPTWDYQLKDRQGNVKSWAFCRNEAVILEENSEVILHFNQSFRGENNCIQLYHAEVVNAHVPVSRSWYHPHRHGGCTPAPAAAKASRPEKEVLQPVPTANAQGDGEGR